MSARIAARYRGGWTPTSRIYCQAAFASFHPPPLESQHWAHPFNLTADEQAGARDVHDPPRGRGWRVGGGVLR